MQLTKTLYQETEESVFETVNFSHLAPVKMKEYFKSDLFLVLWELDVATSYKVKK